MKFLPFFLISSLGLILLVSGCTQQENVSSPAPDLKSDTELTPDEPSILNDVSVGKEVDKEIGSGEVADVSKDLESLYNI